MEAPPVISIIVPVYNVESYIEGCLRSVFAQKGTIPTELILVDDSCSDSSMAIAERVAADAPSHIAIRMLRHEVNRGLSATRNTGTDAAKGDYILYLDSDDQLTPDACSVLLQLIQQSQADIAIGGLHLTTPVNSASYATIPGEWKGEAAVIAIFSRIVKPMAWNKLIRRHYLQQHRLSFKEGLIHEDEHWIARTALCRPHIIATGIPTYLYRNKRLGSIMSVLRPKHIHAKLFLARDIECCIRQETGEVKEVSTSWVLLHLLDALLLHTKSVSLSPAEVKGCHLFSTSCLINQLCTPEQQAKLYQHKNLRYQRVARICQIHPTFLSRLLLFFYFRKNLSR